MQSSIHWSSSLPHRSTEITARWASQVADWLGQLCLILSGILTMISICMHGDRRRSMILLLKIMNFLLLVHSLASHVFGISCIASPPLIPNRVVYGVYLPVFGFFPVCIADGTARPIKHFFFRSNRFCQLNSTQLAYCFCVSSRSLF